ncbi:MAG TPA: hypothetical protein VG847_03775 [Chitinophagaceae bacterium]|nr:hypothetical protein [Chitinophagaceae bacterium]
MIQRLFYLAILTAFLLSANTGFAFAIRPLSGNTVAVPNNYDYLRGDVFVKMSAKEFAKATGTHLNFFERMYFRMIKRQVKRDLKHNPDLLITDYYDTASGKFKFNALWFVIAAIIGPLGVLLAYVSHPQKNGPDKKDRTTSAWLGFAFWILWFGYIFIF